jgi:hypothetical protein
LSLAAVDDFEREKEKEREEKENLSSLKICARFLCETTHLSYGDADLRYRVFRPFRCTLYSHSYLLYFTLCRRITSVCFNNEEIKISLFFFFFFFSLELVFFFYCLFWFIFDRRKERQKSDPINEPSHEFCALSSALSLSQSKNDPADQCIQSILTLSTIHTHERIQKKE